MLMFKVITTNVEALKMQLIPVRTIDQIKADEGFKSKPYRCTAGKTTIGYGRNIEDNGITKSEAETLLLNDVKTVQVELLNKFDWFAKLNGTRQGVLINMAFNLGLPRLMKFKKMLSALSGGDYQEASIQMLDSRWAVQVGDRANRLAKQIIEG